jgi:EGF-like domain
MDVINGYACVCPNHHLGVHCETPRASRCGATADENPCINGGRCIDIRSVDNFRCLCPPGFAGRLCESNIFDGCHSGRPACFNGATCYDIAGGDFICSCPTGYRGRRCEQPVGACASRPCQQEAQCVDTADGGFICTCPGNGSRGLCDRRQLLVALHPLSSSVNATLISDTGSHRIVSAPGSSVSALVLLDTSALTEVQLVLIVTLGGGVPVAVLAVTLVVLATIRRRSSSGDALAIKTGTSDDISCIRNNSKRKHPSGSGDGELVSVDRCVKVTNEERKQDCSVVENNTNAKYSQLAREDCMRLDEQNNLKKCEIVEKQATQEVSKLFAGQSRLSLPHLTVHR